MKRKVAIICIFSVSLILVFLLIFRKHWIGIFYNNQEIVSLVDMTGGFNVATSFSKANIKWLTYQNEKYGFIFSYPDKSIDSSYWTGQSANPAAASQDILVPNKILEKNNVFYIRSGNQSFEQVEAIYNKIQADSGGADKYGLSWRMVIKDINSEQELGAFIKDQYGSACSYKKTATVFSDTLDVIIKGDGKPLDLSGCPVNYNYHIKYSPVNKKVAFWQTGQECQVGLNFSNCFDEDIVKSFNFVNIKRTEPISYSLTGISLSVSKEIKPFDFTAAELTSAAEECGAKHDVGYFDALVSKFSGSSEIIYKFKPQGDNQDDSTFVVTLLPNKAEYSSLDQFKKDFDICSVGEQAYPQMLNSDWLLFVNSCGSGFDDGSGRIHSCDEIRKIVEPSLKFN